MRLDAIGDSIADKGAWSGVLNLPGMRTCTVSGVRPDKYAGRIDVRVEPSGSARPGIFVACNDHYELHVVDGQPKTRDDGYLTQPVDWTGLSVEKNLIARTVLADEWSASIARAEAIISRVAEQGA